jgi:Ca2+-binding EF-hand superfamily protein
MQSTFVLMFAAALLGAGMAIAQSSTETTPSGKPRFFAKFEEQFKAADKDGDGALSRSEAEDAHMGRIVDNFDRLDTNKDGRLTREEIRNLIRSRVSS